MVWWEADRSEMEKTGKKAGVEMGKGKIRMGKGKIRTRVGEGRVGQRSG